MKTTSPFRWLLWTVCAAMLGGSLDALAASRGRRNSDTSARQEEEQAPATPAAAEWANIEKLRQGPQGKPTTRAEAAEIMFNHLTLMKFQLDAFIEKYAGEPQRWDAEVLRLIITPQLDKNYQRQTDWEAIEAGYARVLAEPKATAKTKTEARIALLDSKIGQLPAEPTLEQITPLVPGVEELSKTNDQRVVKLMQVVFKRLDALDPNAGEALLQKLSRAKNQLVVLQAKSELKIRELKQTPIELTFTAVDGRKVDLKALRGKVVLLNFWATSLKNSAEEEAKLAAAYAKYQARGFEIIGVSLDESKDKKKVLAFVKEQGLAWPQHFDGGAWNSELSKRFNIVTMPTRWLFDKQGRLAQVTSTQALDGHLEKLLAD